jgi:hypothetical protein
MSLLGTWVVDTRDRRALDELGDVLLEFHDDGQLTYTIRDGTREQLIVMRYRLDGATIVTDQPSAPNVERTAWSLSSDEVLTLRFDGVPYRFRRL